MASREQKQRDIPHSLSTYCRALCLGGWSLLDGMLVTLKNLFSRPVTRQYPHEMGQLPERSRGTLVLAAEPEGLRCTCTACQVCEVICPNNSIHIESVRDPETKKKHLKGYRWDSDRCIYCGLCVEACNFNSLAWSPEFEHAVADRKGLVLDEREMVQAWLRSVGRADAGAKNVEDSDDE